MSELTRTDIWRQYQSLDRFWEDTSLVTEPNHVFATTVGQIQRVLLHTIAVMKVVEEQETRSAVVSGIEDELARAKKNHGPIASLHEGYGVILEEVEEFWAEVRKKKSTPARVKAELEQIAAMAIRVIEDCGLADA